MTRLITLALIVAGIIHLLPLPGLLGAGQLETLYGVAIADPNLEILMRHRAVLFGLLGLFLVAAAFRPAWQPVAILAGLVSVLSFILIAWLVGDYGAAIRKVVIADLVALLALVLAGTLYLLQRR